MAHLQVNEDLMAVGEERDEGKGEVRMRGELVVMAPHMAVRI